MSTEPSLLELQTSFLKALYEEGAPGPVASIAGNGLAAQARLRIYRHSSRETQTAALRASYPAMLALVGDAWFDQTAHAYRCIYPSRFGNLQQFGAYFADYLETLPARRTLVYLADVARLEWLRQQTILAAESESITFDTFTESLQAGEEALRIVLHPSVHLFASRHKVLTIWQFAQQPDSEQLLLDGRGENVMLWREEDKVAMVELEPATFACIVALEQGASLHKAHTEAAAFEVNFDIASCMASLIERGLITGVRPFSITNMKVQP